MVYLRKWNSVTVLFRLAYFEITTKLSRHFDLVSIYDFMGYTGAAMAHDKFVLGRAG